jgi:hypothetical protein
MDVPLVKDFILRLLQSQVLKYSHFSIKNKDNFVFFLNVEDRTLGHVCA